MCACLPAAHRSGFVFFRLKMWAPILQELHALRPWCGVSGLVGDGREWVYGPLCHFPGILHVCVCDVCVCGVCGPPVSFLRRGLIAGVLLVRLVLRCESNDGNPLGWLARRRIAGGHGLERSGGVHFG